MWLSNSEISSFWYFSQFLLPVDAKKGQNKGQNGSVRNVKHSVQFEAGYGGDGEYEHEHEDEDEYGHHDGGYDLKHEDGYEHHDGEYDHEHEDGYGHHDGGYDHEGDVHYEHDVNSGNGGHGFQVGFNTGSNPAGDLMSLFNPMKHIETATKAMSSLATIPATMLDVGVKTGMGMMNTGMNMAKTTMDLANQFNPLNALGSMTAGMSAGGGIPGGGVPRGGVSVQVGSRHPGNQKNYGGKRISNRSNQNLVRKYHPTSGNVGMGGGNRGNKNKQNNRGRQFSGNFNAGVSARHNGQIKQNNRRNGAGFNVKYNAPIIGKGEFGFGGNGGQNRRR